MAVDSYADNPVTRGVRTDDFTGGRLAAEHLRALGHVDVVFAGPRFAGQGVVWQRFQGFNEGFGECAVEAVNTTYDDGVALGRRLRAEHPSATAVFATADILAIGVVAGLQETGARVPDDISVMGFDDLDLCRYVRPTLTTIAQDLPAKAATAVAMLIAEIERDEAPPASATLEVRLVERGSTGPVASPG